MNVANYVPTQRGLRRYLVRALKEKGRKDLGFVSCGVFDIGNLRPDLEPVEIDAAVLRFYSERGYKHRIASGISHLHLFRMRENKRTDTSVIVDYKPGERKVVIDVHRIGWKAKGIV
jgi:hypothetical protein